MSGSNPSLKQLLKKLQKGAGLAPPTPDEADALMAGPEEAPIDDGKLLDIGNAVVRGEPSRQPELPASSWSEHEDALSEAEREEFVLNRNKGEVDDETKKQIEEAEQKALSDDQKADDEAGLDGEANPS